MKGVPSLPSGARYDTGERRIVNRHQRHEPGLKRPPTASSLSDRPFKAWRCLLLTLRPVKQFRDRRRRSLIGSVQASRRNYPQHLSAVLLDRLTHQTPASHCRRLDSVNFDLQCLVKVQLETTRGKANMACGNPKASWEGLVSLPVAVGHPRLQVGQASSPEERSQAAATAIANAERAISHAQQVARSAATLSALSDAIKSAERAVAEARRRKTPAQIRRLETALSDLKRQESRQLSDEAANARQRAREASSSGNPALAAVMHRKAAVIDTRRARFAPPLHSNTGDGGGVDSDPKKYLSELQKAFIEAHDPITFKLDPELWMSKVNPEFEGYLAHKGKMPHNINCALTAQAVASALDGRPRIAAGATRGTGPEDMQQWSGVEQRQCSVNVIESTLRSMPSGSHAVVGVDFPNGTGHWFNAWWDGDTVWMLDGQDGTCHPWPPSYENVITYDAIFTEGGSMQWTNKTYEQ